MTGLTRGYLDELKAASAFTLLEVATEDKLDSIVTKLKSELGAPYRMSASWPTRDAILHFAAPRAVAADGGAKIPPIQDDLAQMGAAEITLNVQSGAITGGTITRNGVTFAMPTANQNEYLRVVFVQKSDGSVDCNWSAAVASYGALPDPGSLFTVLDGNPLGVIDLQQTTAVSGATYKTADSLTDIVEPAVGGAPRIWRFGSGAGVGAGGDTSFKLQSMTGTIALIKKGRWDFGQYKVISGNVSTDAPVDVSLDVSALVPSPTAATPYYLFIDLLALSAEAVMSDTGVAYKKVYSSSHFVLSTTMDVDRRRYFWVGTFKTAGATWTGAKVQTSPSRDIAPEVVADMTKVRKDLEESSKQLPYELATIVDMGDSPESLIHSSSTGLLSYRARAYQLDTADELITENLLDQGEFIDEGLVASQVDLLVMWKFGKIDTAATYYVSRNGGTNWEAVTMERLGIGTNLYYGRFIFGTYANTDDLRVRIVSGTNAVELEGIALCYYNVDAGMMITGRNNTEMQVFDGKTEKLSPCSFTLTRFIPDPDYIVAMCDGGCYHAGDFTIDGQTITFPDGFFETPDTKSMKIKFFHIGAGSFDNADVNAALLAIAHVANADPNFDRGVEGRGFPVKRPDGVIVEIGADNENNVVVLDT